MHRKALYKVEFKDDAPNYSPNLIPSIITGLRPDYAGCPVTPNLKRFDALADPTSVGTHE